MSLRLADAEYVGKARLRPVTILYSMCFSIRQVRLSVRSMSLSLHYVINSKWQTLARFPDL